jgi:hypothetical protein
MMRIMRLRGTRDPQAGEREAASQQRTGYDPFDGVDGVHAVS